MKHRLRVRTLLTVFLLCGLQAFVYAQPANNLCSNAIALTSSTTCINTGGTLVSSTYTPPLTGCGATNKSDVWYTFVALASTETITVSSGPSQVRVQLFSGSCASLTSVACANNTIVATSLTVGATYYIRVYTQNNNLGTFNICVSHAPPANDDCAGAVSLTSNPTCINTASNLNLATATAGLPAGCQPVGTHYDVWFSFVAANTTETVTISGLGANITNPRIQLYSGTCGALTSLTCGTTTLTNAALTIGTTYYVRVANLATNPSGAGTVADFNICVTHTAPANDDCSAAVSLTSGTTCVNTGGTLTGAMYTTIPSIGCGTVSRNDVWYSFVAAASSTTITLSSAPANPRLQVFSGSCASLTSVACGTNTVTATGLSVGSTYYVRVYTDPNVSGTFNICVTHTAPVNDNCAGALSLISGTSCVNTAGSLNLATVTGGLPAGCQPVGNHYDVWYTFVAAATSQTVTISGLGANISNPRIQLYSGTCAGLTSLTCGTTTLTNAALTIGNTYYIRVSNLTTDPSGNGTTANFNICITHTGLANDLCAGAIPLTSGYSCSPTAGTLVGATYTTIPSLGCASGDIDAWYSFVAQSSSPTITTNSGSSRFRVQLFSGSCGSLTSLNCSSNNISASGLTVGATYYIRVWSSNGSTFTFDLCVTDPAIVSVIDYSKSYINVTKLATGGSVEPGDILEIRATFVVRSGTVDSVAYYDTLTHNDGFLFQTGTLSTQTNEGKVFRGPFTDGFDSDAGTTSVVPLTSDTAIQINMGTGATGTARGSFSNTSKPSFYGGTCIIMATYRVQVYAGYDNKINWGGGAFIYRDASSGTMRRIDFKNDSLAVYISPGLCSNAVSSVNKVGIETNGTFNTPSGAAPLARNRGSSAAVPGYTYATFRVGNGPQDYYYGISNNTSATFSTINTLAKGGAVPQRVFNLWDIVGDHTGASNTAKGNQPCDTTQPVSASNPCGYMLVVNSAYKTDTAFRSTITNLCPNTYYEISVWMRNICYKCGCDSNGVGASTAGYKPFAPNDSSGIQPNLAFQVNGQDYYSTGNIPYSGTGPGITQQASDSVNQWVKRGFVYKTENTQTGFEFLIRNNAPGGGGNDWAIDDIVVSTCLPNMNYSPSLLPAICDSNALTINDTVRSSYENYTYYKWQRSTDGGANWSDITGPLGPATPVWNGTAWEYVASYTIPPTNTLLSDSADLYRMIVATTAANLSNVNCQFTDVVSIITLDVIDCGIVLNVDMLTFNGKLVNDHANLSWSTTGETEPLHYDIERSFDGISFTKVGTVNSNNNYGGGSNYYSFIDPSPLTGKAWYRIAATNNKLRTKYTRVIQLSKAVNQFDLVNLVNPFTEELPFDIMTPENGKIDVTLIDIVGNRIRSQSFLVNSGVNSLSLKNTGGLPPGMYIIQIKNKDVIINRKVLKN